MQAEIGRSLWRSKRRDFRGRFRRRRLRSPGNPQVYSDPSLFFRNTHPARDLTRIVQEVFSALSKDGEPGLALRLSTGFGGGKTHTLLTLWHLVARGAAAESTDDLESSDQQDIDEMLGDSRAPRVPSSLPDSPVTARQELRDVHRLLQQLDALAQKDSKLDHFMRSLQHATDDGRACLVFSEFTDTVEYLRDSLFPGYGAGLACYTGDGGSVYEAGKWKHVSKEEITKRLTSGDVRVLLCSDAASEGLNLQAASALINYDLPWNPARVEQRIGRIDRIGQQASDLRIVNLFLANSVDDRVYQVLNQRCDLFQSYVGAMQPVLSIARRMLLGVQRFDAGELNQEADRARDDAIANAAFESTHEHPPLAEPSGTTVEDLARAHEFLKRGTMLQTSYGSRSLAVTWRDLASDKLAVPLSPFSSELRRIGHELIGAGERVPLILEAVEKDAFRVVVAVWAHETEHELIDRAERLEALLGTWNGAPVSEQSWKNAHAAARQRAQDLIEQMATRAEEVERAALRRQLDAARSRLLRELGRFLACSATEDEDFNTAFHRAMQRGGQVGALVARAHGLIGYPDWPSALIRSSLDAAAQLSKNQRTNVLLGTPLEAAVRDPRWQAVATLQAMG